MNDPRPSTRAIGVASVPAPAVERDAVTVRAVEQVAATEPAATEPAIDPPVMAVPTGRGRLGRVSLGQVATVQLVVVAMLAASTQPWPVLVPVLGAGLLAVGVTVTGRDGRWWYEEISLRWRLHRRTRRRQRTGARRRRAADAMAAPDAPGNLSPAGVAGGLTVTGMSDRGTRIGLGMDESGFFSVLAVTVPEPASHGVGHLDGLRHALSGVEVPVSAVQVCHHVVPLPTVTSAAGAFTWVALRLARDDAAAEAANRGGGLDGVHRTMAATLGRVRRALRGHGIECRPLVADEVAGVVATVAGTGFGTRLPGSAHPDPAEVGEVLAERLAAAPARETWHAWETADVTHCGLQLTGTLSLDGLCGTLRDSSVLSYTISWRDVTGSDRPGGGSSGRRKHRSEAVLRVGAAPGMLAGTLAEVAAAVGRPDCLLYRLDGQHGPAVYASAPTGADLR